MATPASIAADGMPPTTQVLGSWTSTGSWRHAKPVRHSFDAVHAGRQIGLRQGAASAFMSPAAERLRSTHSSPGAQSPPQTPAPGVDYLGLVSAAYEEATWGSIAYRDIDPGAGQLEAGDEEVG